MNVRMSRRRILAILSIGVAASPQRALTQGAPRTARPNVERPPLPPGIPRDPREIVVTDFGSWHVVSIANNSTAWIPAERIKTFQGGKPGMLLSGGMQSVSEGLEIRDAKGNVSRLPIKTPSGASGGTPDTRRYQLIGGRGELKIEYWSLGSRFSGNFRLSTTSNGQGSLPVTIFIDGKEVKSLVVKDFADVSATELFGRDLAALPAVRNLKATSTIDGETYSIYEVDLTGTADAMKQMRLIPDYNHNVRGMGPRTGGGDASQPGKCFLTTACCEVMGRADDCYELSTLRRFRDTVMLATEEGRLAVEQYYWLAPRILDEMRRRGEVHRLRIIYFRTILPCVALASFGLNGSARRNYMRMMLRLSERYAQPLVDRNGT